MPAMSAIAITGARVWDGESEAPSESPQTIRVEGARIVGIGSAPELLDGARRLDMNGAFALPGLIDAHVHMVLDPSVRKPADQLRLSAEEIWLGMQARALDMVRAGITTARDLGGPEWRELALRDGIASGEISGPRLICAGQPVTVPKGHTWFWGGEASDADEIREVVKRQCDHGTDWIKVMATGGVMTPGTSPGSAQFEVEELRCVVEAARERGREVAAHCHGTEGIDRAAQAGVRTIEHCSFAGKHGFGSGLDADVVGRIAASGAFVSPTVGAGWKRYIDPEGPLRGMGIRMALTLRAMVEAGIPLITSTDAGIPGVFHHLLPKALPVFGTLAALDNLAVLRCATSQAARGLGIGDLTGVLRPGLEADVLVVDGDPSVDLVALERPRLVLARGRRIPLGS